MKHFFHEIAKNRLHLHLGPGIKHFKIGKSNGRNINKPDIVYHNFIICSQPTTNIRKCKMSNKTKRNNNKQRQKQHKG